MARPPRGHPVLFQAGSSETGREVAARFAEGVFTPQHTLEGAQEFYRDLKGRMARYGRPPEAFKIMPGLNAIVGRTKEEAQETHRFLQSKIHPDVGLELLSNQLGNFDLLEYDLDGPLPDVPESRYALASLTSTRNIVRWAREEGLTIRQIFYKRFAGARGQRTLIGSPVEIVDEMEKWFCSYGVDGFLVHPSHLPGGLNDFVELVVPELQNRRLFRSEYRAPPCATIWGCSGRQTAMVRRAPDRRAYSALPGDRISPRYDTVDPDDANIDLRSALTRSTVGFHPRLCRCFHGGPGCRSTASSRVTISPTLSSGCRCHSGQ